VRCGTARVARQALAVLVDGAATLYTEPGVRPLLSFIDDTEALRALRVSRDQESVPAGSSHRTGCPVTPAIRSKSWAK
jgi:hypothetical protein